MNRPLFISNDDERLIANINAENVYFSLCCGQLNSGCDDKSYKPVVVAVTFNDDNLVSGEDRGLPCLCLLCTASLQYCEKTTHLPRLHTVRVFTNSMCLCEARQMLVLMCTCAEHMVIGRVQAYISVFLSSFRSVYVCLAVWS